MSAFTLLPRGLRALTLAAASVALLAGVACGGGSKEPAPTPPGAPAAAYPVKVVDLAGRSVEIRAKPTAVVALSPSAAEFVYAAGGTIIGRASSVKFPESALQAKEVGTAYQPNLDAILALRPDLIVADSVIHTAPQFKQPMEALGVPVVFVGAESYQNVIDGLKIVGRIFDGVERTDALINDINKARDDAKAVISSRKLSALVLISDRDQVLYGAKSTSYAGDILTQLGLTNPASGLPDAGPFPGYTAIAAEKILEFNPDLVFTITPAPEPAPRLSALFVQIPPFRGLKAVTGKHVVELSVDWLLQAPGPRIIDAMRAIAEAAKAPGS